MGWEWAWASGGDVSNKVLPLRLWMVINVRGKYLDGVSLLIKFGIIMLS